MNEAGIFVSTSALAAMSPELKVEIARMLGLEVPDELTAGELEQSGAKLADLDLPAARMFLSGCSEKTTKVLALILSEPGSFYLRALERAARASRAGLRGVWTGITKRTRTVTGDPDAALIGWKSRGDDWEGWLSPATRASLKAALALD